MLHDSLTARRAAAIIAAFTMVITVVGGILERVLDHHEYPTIGKGLWFALQTVTTVGYGDVTPRDSVGRFIAAVVMLAGIGFLAVITAAATASLIEGSRRRFAAQAEAAEARQLDQISQRLARIERALDQSPGGRSPDAQDDAPGTIGSGTSEELTESPESPSGESPPSGRIRRMFAGTRDMWRIVYRDPEHVAERLTLYAANRLGDPSREWAQTVRRERPDTHRAQIAEELRTRSAQIARIDGAIAGTPFFVALVPGYLTYLMQEMRMTLHTAALYDRDPRTLRTSAEMLALRGLHPDVESAEAALNSVRETRTPIVRPSGDRGANGCTASI